MWEAFFAAILLVLGLLAILFLGHHRWENSSYVKTIDRIPGPKKKPIFGNATALPKEIDGKILCTRPYLKFNILS